MLLASFLFLCGCLLRLWIHVRALQANESSQQGAEEEEEQKVEGDDVENEPSRSTHAISRQRTGIAVNRAPSFWRGHSSLLLTAVLGEHVLKAWLDFKQRFIHSQLILLSIFYL